MVRWDYTLDFTHFYHNDDLTIKEKGEMVSKKINRVLKKYLDWDNNRDHFDFELDDIQDAMMNITGHVGTCTERSVYTEEFNEWMDALYDWCDSNRVWIKTR